MADLLDLMCGRNRFLPGGKPRISARRLLGSVLSGRARRPSTISRRLLKLHQFKPGAVSCFGFITSWRGCFAIKTNSTTRTITSNKPSHTRTKTHTTWVARRRCTLGFGTNKGGLMMQDLRLCTPSRLMRRSGRRGSYGEVQKSSWADCRLKEQWRTGLPTEIPAVSFWKRTDAPHLLTLLPQSLVAPKV